MPFGFSSSTNRSQTDSSSSSFDNLDASGFSFGRSGNFATSSSVGSSESGSAASSASTSRQAVAFSDIFQELFTGASSVAQRLAGDTTLLDTANNLFESGAGFLDTLESGGAGAQFLEDRLAGSGQLVEERIGAVGNELERFLIEQVNPNITSAGVSAGTLGGDRNSIARGVAGGNAAREFTRAAVDIRSNEQSALDAIAGALAQNESSRSTAGVGAVGALQGLAESGFSSALTPFAALSQILGPQTVLTTGDSASTSESFGVSQQLASALSEAFGINLGANTTTGRAGSESRSRTRSSGSSRGVDIGSIFG